MVTVAGTSGDRHQEFMRGTGNAGDLDKHAFLELLITQMRNQDPLSPTDNGEFLAQMAQFTSLEQVQNINGSLDKLLDGQNAHQSNLLEKMDSLNENMASLLYLFQISEVMSLDKELLLLGKNVTVINDAGEEVTGTVSGVNLGQTGNMLVINGEKYSFTQLVAVGEQNGG